MAFRFRRRPLLRGALVAGAGYAAGSSRAKSRQREAAQDAQIQELQEQAATPEAAPAAAPAGAPAATPAPSTDTDAIAKLDQLASLRQQGLLTDEEFAAAKAKLLGL